MEVRGQDVRVVDRYGEFGKDVLVAETTLLETVGAVSICCFTFRSVCVCLRLGCELAVLVGGHEKW